MKLKVVLRLYRTEDGGRSSAIFSGYRPLVPVGEGHYADISIDLPNGTTVLRPGEESLATVTLLNPATFPETARTPGVLLEVSEVTKTVGELRILEVQDEGVS